MSESTAVREKPILMSTELVQAILKPVEPKSETRRNAKFQPPSEPIAVEWFHPVCIDSEGEEYPGERIFGVYGDDWHLKCPYGAPGDRLWVKETHSHDHPGYPIVYRSDGEIKRENGKFYCHDNDEWFAFKWRPSIFMRRLDSRVDLRIKDIGFERLQEITDEYILNEGMESRSRFAGKWDELNGAGHWASNPYVWVIKFKRVSGSQP